MALEEKCVYNANRKGYIGVVTADQAMDWGLSGVRGRGSGMQVLCPGGYPGRRQTVEVQVI